MTHALGWHIVFLLSVAMWRGMQGDFDPERTPLPGSPEQHEALVSLMILTGLAVWLIRL